MPAPNAGRATNTYTRSADGLRRDRRAADAARGGGIDRRSLRPRVLRRKVPHVGKKTDELWDELASAGYLGVNVPEAIRRRRPGHNRARDRRRGARRARDARCSCSSSRLPSAPRSSPRSAPTISDPLASGIRGRLFEDGVRDHRARRRIELAQHLDDRRRATGTSTG